MNYCFECDKKTNCIHTVVVLNKTYGKVEEINLPLCPHCADNNENYSICSECGKLYSVEGLKGLDSEDIELCPHCLLELWEYTRDELEQQVRKVTVKLRQFFKR